MSRASALSVASRSFPVCNERIVGMLTQSTWRKAGAFSIGLAAVMAVYSIPGGILRDSVIYAARFVSSEIGPEVETTHAWPFCVLYWGIFSVTILVSLYLALLDIRYIRLNYALEKQKLFQKTMSDEIDDE